MSNDFNRPRGPKPPRDNRGGQRSFGGGRPTGPRRPQEGDFGGQEGRRDRQDGERGYGQRGDRRSEGGERPARYNQGGGRFDRQSDRGDRPARQGQGDRPRFDRQSESGDRPARYGQGGGQRSDRGERPARYGQNDRPRFDRQSEGGDRPVRYGQGGGQRSDRGERPARYGQDRPRFDRRPEGGDRPARFERGPRPATPRPAPAQGEQELRQGPPDDIVCGRNPVRETLKAGRNIQKMYVVEGLRDLTTVRVLVATAVEKGVPVTQVPRQKLDMVCGGANHQGVALVVPPIPYVDLDEVVARAKASDRAPLLLALDGIEDPGNLGALLRVCDCVGAHGVIITKRRSAGLTASVVRASSGAAEWVPVAQVPNLRATLEELKQQDFWIMGADADAPVAYGTDLTGPAVLVIGSEGKGIGPLVRSCCDRVVSLPLLGRVESLNAATAGAALMYEILRQRGV